IRAALVSLAEAGAAVLVMSEDLEELFELCRELVVMARGRLSSRLPVADATPELIGRWMAGRFEDEATSRGVEAHA
ncbi:MAG TPA: ABC transporter ATP-binding protein, partial [Polyangia bacterium]